ncbi:hypothetical protein [Duganella sp. HH101]|uniref:hypothetical protein n=1 Tax=Duganella sp. HH101 TaxID=1781066 RepID=UPI000893D633|nr:hypothetical protein [Duganella sp. HH101]OFA00176.1 hypothetical protein DUGA2_50090 [Duganella sp. HH101]
MPRPAPNPSLPPSSDTSGDACARPASKGTLSLPIASNGLGYIKHILLGEARLFAPLTILAALLMAIYLPGQMVTLSRSMTAGWRIPAESYDGAGFYSGDGTLILWWSLCCGVILTLASFLKPQTVTALRSPYGRSEAWTQRLVVVLVSHSLILAPLFLHPKIYGWFPFPILGLIGSGVTMVLLSKHDKTGAVLLFTAILTSQVAVLHGRENVAFIVGGAVLVLLHLRPNLKSKLGFPRWLASLIASNILLGSNLIAFIFVGAALPWRMPGDHHFDYHAVMLALWWLLPSFIATIAIRRPRTHETKCRVPWAVLLWGIPLSAAGVFPNDMLALNTLCAAAGLMIATAKLLQGEGAMIARRVFVLFTLGYAAYSIWLLDPTYEVDGERRSQQIGAWNREQGFNAFIDAWTAARGERLVDHGPIILLAASGGGLRAAAHAALAFTTADDLSNGLFGQRVLAVSGVSGGALGAVTWLGARNDGSRAESANPMKPLGDEPRLPQLARFYSGDFVSPLANTLLTHDLLPAATPIVTGHSRRADVLSASWQAQWEKTFPDNGTRIPDPRVFAHSVGDFAAKPGQMPMVILNTTAASDGQRAVYSSIDAKFPGAAHLDPNTTVATAVSDSARFAFISPVVQSCADQPPAAPKLNASALKCRPGYFPITIADGGYADNSGLASIHDILDELVASKRGLENVFVIIVKSNPSEDMPFNEGTRFDNGRLIAELAAPGYVLEGARSGHSSTYERLIRRRLPSEQVITWELTYHELGRGFRPTPRPNKPDSWFAELQQRSQAASALQALNLPPLGWTLDPASFEGIRFQSRLHPNFGPHANCGNNVESSPLCRSMMAAKRLLRP